MISDGDDLPHSFYHYHDREYTFSLIRVLFSSISSCHAENRCHTLVHLLLVYDLFLLDVSLDEIHDLRLFRTHSLDLGLPLRQTPKTKILWISLAWKFSYRYRYCIIQYRSSQINHMIFLLPTDTCYGLAWGFNEQDYLEIYRRKWRDFTKQLALLVEDFDDMRKYIEISDEQIDFLRHYPYPWSFLGKRNPEFQLPDWMDSEKYSMISLRVASVCIRHREEWSDPEIQKWIISSDWIASQARNDETWKIQFPLFLTSANLAGMPESKTLAEARGIFPGVEWIDGGICDRPPSDIFSIGEDGELRYVRRNY